MRVCERVCVCMRACVRVRVRMRVPMCETANKLLWRSYKWCEKVCNP